MNLKAKQRNRWAAFAVLALALALPRILVPPGFMPGMDHDGRWTLVFCDPALRAAFSGHVHSHGHDHSGSEVCPFGMTGGPALLPQLALASSPAALVEHVAPVTAQRFSNSRFHSAYGARAPPGV